MARTALRRILALTLVVIFTILSALFVYVYTHKLGMPVAPLPRVAHAGGGFNGATYTNSLQALDHNAEKFELFEIDFSFTAEGELVCIHDWGISAELAFGAKFDVPPTLNQFIDYVSGNNRYTNCTLDTLVKWLGAHPGKRVVTDIKENNLRALKIIANRYPGMRKAIIPQIYHVQEYAEVKKLGFHHVILTLYRWDSNMSYVIFRALFMDLFAVTIPIERAYYARYFKKLGIPTYVHTINTSEGLEIMRAYGVTEVYTDWLVK